MTIAIDTATFAHHELGSQRIIELLATTGFDFDEARSSTRSVLDTFDGRIHALGFRLEAVDSAEDLQLVLTGSHPTPQTAATGAVPRLGGDLPPGALGDRLRTAIGLRALIPMVTFSDRVSTTTERNAKCAPVAHLLVHDSITMTKGATVPATVEIVAVPGHHKAASRVQRRLEQSGFVRIGGDLISVVLAADGVDPAGFTSDPTVPLATGMPAVEGFRAVLLNLAEAIGANWQGTIDDVDTEFLHELRVAVRRTRSVIRHGKGVLPVAVGAPFGEDFAWLAAATSATRDLDVYMLEWPGYVTGMTPQTTKALGTVLRHLERRRQRARAELVDVLQSARAHHLMRSWHEALADDRSTSSSDATAALGRIVAKRFRKAHQTVLDHGRLIDIDSPPDDFHELRKDAKKLRYLIECFASVMPPKQRNAFLSQLKGLQDNLGAYQDAEVHATELNVVARELGARRAATGTLVALGRLTERLDQAQQQARAEFATRFRKYDSHQTKRIVADLLDALVDSST